MNKKILLLTSIVLFVIAVAICLKLDVGKNARITVASDKKIEQIKAKSEVTDMAFLLCYEDEKLPYDASTKTFYLPLDMENAEWENGKFSGAFIKTDDGEMSSEGSSDKSKTIKADLFFATDYTQTDKQLAIANGDAFSFYALSKEGYGEYKVVFTGLPIITFSGTEYMADDGTQMFELRVYDTDHSDDWVTNCYTQSRLRGNTSLTYEKKSLRLYLKDVKDDGTFKKASKNLLGLRDDDDWILNALYADNSRIRDQLCIDLWNEVGAKDNPYGYSYGTDCVMTEVFINDGYQGIYDLMIPIDAKQLGLDAVSEQMEKSEEVIERIYKKKYSRDWVSEDFIGDLPDSNAVNYRGGFYLKGDTVLQNEEEWASLYRLAKDLEASDAEFAGDILAFNDQQNLIDNWLFYQAIAGFDNQNKNYYYVTRSRDGKSYGYFIPWDLNISFGMVYADNEYYSAELDTVVNEPVCWQPANRMIELDVDNSKRVLKSTWTKWRSNQFSDEAIAKRIAELEHQVKASGAFSREDVRYPNGNQKADFSYMYDFALERLAWLDQYVDEMTR